MPHLNVDDALALPANARYEHLLRRAVETKLLWSLGDGEGFALLHDPDSGSHVPVWPDADLAAACAPPGFPLEPQAIELLNWMEHWTAELLADSCSIAAFPTPDGVGVSIGPAPFREDLENELKRQAGINVTTEFSLSPPAPDALPEADPHAG